MLNRTIINLIIIILLFSLDLTQSTLADQKPTNQIKTEGSIFLFRHAEKQQNAGRNPHLTEQGNNRANNIAQQLKDKNISAIYSTDYFRTMETVKPLSNLLGIAITNYDPRDLLNFAKTISKLEGNIVVVGHSNTTPALINLLGGNKNIVIEDSEYSDLFQLIYSKNSIQTNNLHSKSK